MKKRIKRNSGVYSRCAFTWYWKSIKCKCDMKRTNISFETFASTWSEKFPNNNFLQFCRIVEYFLHAWSIFFDKISILWFSLIKNMPLRIPVYMNKNVLYIRMYIESALLQSRLCLKTCRYTKENTNRKRKHKTWYKSMELHTNGNLRYILLNILN